MADPYRWLEDTGSVRAQTWLAGQRALLERHTDHHRDAMAAWERSLGEIEAAATGRPLSPNAEAGGALFSHELTEQGSESLRVTEPGGRHRVLLEIGDRTSVGRLAGWQPDPGGRMVVAQLHRDGHESGGLHLVSVAPGTEARHLPDAAPHPAVAFTGSFLLYSAGSRTEHALRVHGLQDGTTRSVSSPVPGPVRMSLHAGPGGHVLLRTRTPDGAPARWWCTNWDGRSAPDWHPLPLEGLDISAYALGTDALYVAVRGKTVSLLDLAAVARGAAAPPSPLADTSGSSVRALRVLGPGRSPHLAVLRRTGTTRRLDILRADRAVTGEEADEHGFSWPARLSLGPAGYDGDGRLTGAVWLLADDPRHGALSHRVTPGAAAPATDRRSALRTVIAAGHDGTDVPVTVCDPSPDAVGSSLPTLVTVYGGFGVPLEPSWDPLFAGWLSAGGRVAWVHARGGGEFGAQWAAAGRGPGKSDTVDDLRAGVLALVTSGEARPDTIAGLAASNGGLVLAAAMTRSPDLFAAVACAAPLTDMARYDQGGLGKLWREEYGDPADPGAREALLSYSPYHHVRDGVRYPAALLISGGNDARVRPWHAWKLCAALQSATTADAPVLLDHQEDTGHYGRAADAARTLCARVLCLLASRTGLHVPGGLRPPAPEPPLRSPA
ncbi:prolyl oligopeptidase family serine peptidase [Kitasatospora sp. NPDC101235]|uniref:prolyl oligopeptidase family serine peptidase n=1 Tax=Kitasatospora sp. NPDC101235 TaxID=3364101 RepID=UPI0037F683C3